jgi:hypothetical protein
MAYDVITKLLHLVNNTSRNDCVYQVFFYDNYECHFISRTNNYLRNLALTVNFTRLRRLLIHTCAK